MKKITTVIVTGAAAATFGSMPAQAQCNPCNPCAAQTAVNPCNPCAAANPCNPCAARNPCNPCAANPCNPCAANPCGAGQAAGPVDDPMAEATVKSYKDWRRVNDEPVLSATHGNRWVVTYINEQAESAGLSGDLPFAPGAILAKASFENVNGKPGTPGPLFIMEKRDAGYDPERADWHYAMVVKGVVARAGNAQAGSTVKFCSDCHMAVKAQDYVYGNGTVMKLK